MNDEVHISSLIVQTQPAERIRVGERLKETGVEIHAIGEQGKIVVTLETDSEAGVLEIIDRINRIDGVLSAVLVYHHCESRDSLEEEIVYENHSS